MKVRKVAMAVAVAAAAAVLMAACQGSEPKGNVGTGPAIGEAEKIVAKDASFEPELIRLPEGEQVIVEISNEGDMPHEFSIDALDISTGNIDPGKTKTLTFEVPSGETEYACKYHSGMTGTIVAEQVGGQR
jgi:plastocyanin